MPKLQTINGCFEDAERATQYGAFEYSRCPRTLVEEREIRVLGLFRDGYLEGMTPMARRTVPAKLRAAVEFVAELAQAVPSAG